MGKKYTAKRLLAIVSCVALLLGNLVLFGHAQNDTTPQDQSSDEISQQIDALKKQEAELMQQFSELEKKLTDNTGAMADAVQQKDLLDQQIVLLHDQISNTNDQISAYSQMIADRQEELDNALARQAELQKKHKARIRAMEERGKLSYWSVLFHAQSFADLLDRLSMIEEIVLADQRNLSDLRQTSAAVNAMKSELESKRTQLADSRKQLTQSQEELENKRQESDSLLQGLVAKGAEYEALLEESEKKQDELMAQLAQKKSEYNAAAYQEWLSTSVPSEDGSAPPPPTADAWITPVPYYTLTSPFGLRFHPVLNVWRMHNGVDMACAANTPIYATRGGLVITTDYQPDGAGNYVQIDHGDGYRSIYMHMTRYIVNSGQYVAPGQVIGYVGSTGISTGNHLHFGISYNGVYVNPMQFVS